MVTWKRFLAASSPFRMKNRPMWTLSAGPSLKYLDAALAPGIHSSASSGYARLRPPRRSTSTMIFGLTSTPYFVLQYSRRSSASSKASFPSHSSAGDALRTRSVWPTSSSDPLTGDTHVPGRASSAQSIPHSSTSFRSGPAVIRARGSTDSSTRPSSPTSVLVRRASTISTFPSRSTPASSREPSSAESARRLISLQFLQGRTPSIFLPSKRPP